MAGPGWLDGIFAALMMLIALCCAGRLAIGRLRGRATELDADGLHVVMGVAMAGMFEPRLNLLPASAWGAVFASRQRGSSGAHSASAAGPSALAMRISRCPTRSNASPWLYMLLPASAAAAHGRAWRCPA